MQNRDASPAVPLNVVKNNGGRIPRVNAEDLPSTTLALRQHGFQYSFLLLSCMSVLHGIVQPDFSDELGFADARYQKLALSLLLSGNLGMQAQCNLDVVIAFEYSDVACQARGLVVTASVKRFLDAT
jgi:hypothetical protein